MTIISTTPRFAAWVIETKTLIAQPVDGAGWVQPLTKAVVYALLTIAIAIHEAGETRPRSPKSVHA